MYLNEFDRFVRHELKPFAYLRYGDDFIIFSAAQNQAKDFRLASQGYLSSRLGLYLHQDNDIIVKSSEG